MGWSILAANSAQNGQNTSVTSSAIDTRGADLLIIGFSGLNDPSLALTDSSTNTWLTALSSDNGNPAVSVRVLYVSQPLVSSAHTFTVSEPNGFAALSILAVSGSLNSTGVFDQGNFTEYQNTGQTDLSPGSITPGHNGELLVGFINIYNDSTPPTLTDSSTNFTEQTHVDCSGSNFGMSAWTFVQTTASAINPPFTRSPGQPVNQGGDWSAIVSFQAAPAGSVGSVSGHSAVAGVGAAQFKAVGSAAGAAAVAGVGAAQFRGVGSVGGAATVTGVGAAQFQGVGSVSGSASVSGVGTSQLALIATEAATEQGDQALFGVSVYNTPVMVAMGVHLQGNS